MFHHQRHAALLAAVLLLLALAPAAVRADGWHNAALATASLDEWLRDLRRGIPDFDARLGRTTLTAGRGPEGLIDRAAAAGGAAGGSDRGASIQANLTPEQQALLGRKANDCMEVLAYMHPNNIIPREFPKFKLSKIPEYRQTAKQMLAMMGRDGSSLVATRLRDDMTKRPRHAPDLKPHPDYYKDLLDVLAESVQQGNLAERDIESLTQAAAGRKATAEQTELARHVERVLSESTGFRSLVHVAKNADNRALRFEYFRKAQRKIPQAKTADLISVLDDVKGEPGIASAINRELAERVPEASVLDLLIMKDKIEDPFFQRVTDTHLARRSPKYREVSRDLAEIWKLAQSPDSPVSKTARWHVENAFQRAPMSQCLLWIGRGGDQLDELIWKQIDGRIKRADANRRAGYRDVALAVLRADVDTDTRLAALDLLDRLKDPQSIRPLIESLTRLPREVCPGVGELLRDMTGQDFGPRAGDSIVNVHVAASQWQKWWKTKGGR
jgi:hypothetical protein